MDSTTLVALAGIGGTLLGTAVGTGSTLGAAIVARRGQADLEDQKARRQAYSACSTNLLARRDGATALLDFLREDVFDQAAAQVRLQNLDEQRAAVAETVGAVAVEGPYAVAQSAEDAAYAIEVLAGRLRDWVADVVGGRDREELVQSQIRYAREDQSEMQKDVDHFTAECRKILHPAESGRRARKRLPWR